MAFHFSNEWGMDLSQQHLEKSKTVTKYLITINQNKKKREKNKVNYPFKKPWITKYVMQYILKTISKSIIIKFNQQGSIQFLRIMQDLFHKIVQLMSRHFT